MRNETRLRFYVDDAQIYRFYFGDFNLTTKYKSPFRYDPNPSFMFKNVGTNTQQRIMWNDFGMTDIPRYDGIGFVMQLFEISKNDAVRKIWREMVRDPKVRLVKVRVEEPLNLPYKTKHRDIQNFEMDYWGKLKFSKPLLKFFNVHSLESMSRVGKVLWESTKDNPTFIYLFSKEGAFKAYRPLDPRKDKFRGQNNGDVLEGYDQLPNSGKYLFITSSLKDTMTLKRAGDEFNGCNPTSENSRKGILKKVEELNKRFEKIYIFFDNDLPGINAAKALNKETGWEMIFLPNEMGKDPSDAVMNSGSYASLRKFLNKYV